MPRQSSLPPDNDYSTFLEGLKQRIRTAQVRAALAVNQDTTWKVIGVETLGQ